jgi:hypothetical protein
MPLANCVRCQKLFNKIRIPVCPSCEPDEEADFEKVRQSLQALPNQSAEEVSESTGVSADCVLRLLDEGRIANVNLSENITCGRCGAPAISLSKRLCQKCLNEISVELAVAQSQIKLPPKRRVEMEMPRSVKDVVDEKRKY